MKETEHLYFQRRAPRAVVQMARGATAVRGGHPALGDELGRCSPLLVTSGGHGESPAAMTGSL